MLNQTKRTAVCSLAMLLASACFAQTEGAKAAPEPTKYFHLDFVVQELEGGKVMNARHYSTTVATGEGPHIYNPTIRTGSKVPISTGSTRADLTYIEVGVNIDCRSARETDGNLALNVAAEISSAVTNSNRPLIRQTKWSSSVIVPVGKPTVLFSSDDLAAKGQMQLELTATAIGL